MKTILVRPKGTFDNRDDGKVERVEIHSRNKSQLENKIVEYIKSVVYQRMDERDAECIAYEDEYAKILIGGYHGNGFGKAPTRWEVSEHGETVAQFPNLLPAAVTFAALVAEEKYPTSY